MTTSDKPAVLGGKSVFKEIVPIVKPPVKAHIERVLADSRRILESGMITNSEYVKKLEKAVANYCEVSRCVATGNCTSGLILTLKALGLKNGEVLIPSFTFPATAHAIYWSGLKTRLVDCESETFNINTGDLVEKITDKSKVIMPVHVFGNPCSIESVIDIAEDRGLKVIFDSAHAFGAKYQMKPIGQFGDAEVFSGSPTKAFTTVEGGLVATNNEEIAKKVEIGRNYGQTGDYNCQMPGLSARMSELHAAVGLNLLPYVDRDIRKRNQIASKYKRELGKLAGVRFQEITPNSLSTYKDFGILINKDEFGLSRDELAIALEKENIMTRKYFYPPIHMQDCYPELKAEENVFPNTDKIANNVLCLPIFSELTDEKVNGITEAITKIHTHAREIKTELHRQASTHKKE